MRNLTVSLLFSGALAGLSACSDGGVYSPSDPSDMDRRMFNERTLAWYADADDRAYVMGHAVGVYLYGKTLPELVAHKGFYYRPGVSSPDAEVAYAWEDVLVARSGGSDGSGGAIYDDVGQPTDSTPPGHPGDYDPTEPGDPSDDVPDPGTDGPGGDLPDGDPDDPGGDPDDPHGEGDCEDDPLIDRECAAFLDPAGLRARELAAQLDIVGFADPGLSGAELDRFVAQFEAGLWHALALETRGEWAGASEVSHLAPDVQSRGLCED